MLSWKNMLILYTEHLLNASQETDGIGCFGKSKLSEWLGRKWGVAWWFWGTAASSWTIFPSGGGVSWTLVGLGNCPDEQSGEEVVWCDPKAACEKPRQHVRVPLGIISCHVRSPVTRRPPTERPHSERQREEEGGRWLRSPSCSGPQLFESFHLRHQTGAWRNPVPATIWWQLQDRLWRIDPLAAGFTTE